jgi:prepilin-type N-terminal cleavage/methylation domain-containing protein
MACHSPKANSSRKAFTLIELLVVIAIIAILSVVVILTLNPAELLRQSRDSSRLSDMATLTSALGIFAANNTVAGALGSASTTYVSIADPSATSTLGDQCQGLGLSSLPTGDAYFCPASTTSRTTNGLGWIPVNFTTIPSGSPLGNLPVDPTNTTSTGLFYTYTTDGSANYEVTALVESQKYKGQLNLNPTNSFFPEVITKGNSLSLSELFNPTGLVGYWNLDEGSGTIAYDISGNGDNGTWSGTAPYYTSGKVGAYAGKFNGSNNALIANNVSPANLTVSFWIQDPTPNLDYNGIIDAGKNQTPQDWYFIDSNTGCGNGQGLIFSALADGAEICYNWGDGGWHMVTGVYSAASTTEYLYIDGVLKGSNNSGARKTPQSYPLDIGKSNGAGGFFTGTLDDIRIYNRAMSVAEIQAIYTAEK